MTKLVSYTQGTDFITKFADGKYLLQLGIILNNEQISGSIPHHKFVAEFVLI